MDGELQFDNVKQILFTNGAKILVEIHFKTKII